ncbi:MAG: aldo/keto reductase [Pseudomonadota bacterium]
MHRVHANGAEIPALGFGTWTLKDATARDLVAAALGAGYRHIDTAAMYENEVDVGVGLRLSGLPREDVFLTTKVWQSDIGPGDLQRSLAASLDRLGTDYVDLVLIHWPSKTIPLAESIAALDEVRERGMARHIGVSNFTTAQVAEAAMLARHPLACNQVEHHPYLDQRKVAEACRVEGMALVSYCPLARGERLFAEPAVAEAAARHGKSPAQVVLRWHVQQPDVVAIPRTSNPERVPENLAIFDFALEPAEMEALNALRSKPMRICDYDFSPVWDPA